MSTPREDIIYVGSNHEIQENHDDDPLLLLDKAKGNELDQDGYQQVYRQNRKRRKETTDKEDTTNSVFTPKRRTTEQANNGTEEKIKDQRTTTMLYFNNENTFNKQNQVNSTRKQIYESSNRKQLVKENFPPFRIMFQDDRYPSQDVAIIKDMNRKCKLNLTYGRMSSSKANKYYLLYCNTSTQFEYLLDKSNWPDKICNQDYTCEPPKRIPSSYSIVMLNVPTQWDVSAFCEELKLQYKTIINGERLYVRGARPIPKIRIDFSSNKELAEILQKKRILLDDGNTSYPIEPYVAPPRVLRCYICQAYDDHIAAHCPNKDKPICFRCGQQHHYDPKCQNKICCAHCKGDHLTGNPCCPKKIETRELKKLQMQSSIVTTAHTTNANFNRWKGTSAQYLFGNLSQRPNSTNTDVNDANASIQLLTTMNSNIGNILTQQNDLNKYLKEHTEQLKCQAKEIIQMNQALYDVVCPLLKEVTHILYTQISSQQKRQLDPSYNRLIDYMNQKELHQSLLNLTQLSTTLQQQQQHINTETSLAKDTNTHTHNESEF